jgi:hypothetical protein
MRMPSKREIRQGITSHDKLRLRCACRFGWRPCALAADASAEMLENLIQRVQRIRLWRLSQLTGGRCPGSRALSPQNHALHQCIEGPVANPAQW